MQVRVLSRTHLRFDDGTPVRAASAVARLGDGWLVAQDDATSAAWQRGGTVSRLRLLPPVEGLEEFSEAAGSKHLKPDLEAACGLEDGRVLLLGSGSTDARMRAVLVAVDGSTRVADLTPLYAAVQAALQLPAGVLNLEGACRRGGRLRWFHRGNPGADVPSSSVDVDLGALLAVFQGAWAGAVGVASVRHYPLGELHGVGLAVTDAVALPDGRVLVSAAAEDTPNAVDDGPVVGAALAVLDDHRVLAVAELPEPHKVEGLAVHALTADGARLIAVVDADDASAASVRLELDVTW